MKKEKSLTVRKGSGSETRIVQRSWDNESIRYVSREMLKSGPILYHGLEYENTPRKSDRKDAAKELREKGFEARDIADMLDMSISYVYRLIRS